MKKNQHQQNGSALITLLAFMAAAAIVIVAAVSIIVLNEQATSKASLAEEAMAVAESGAENGALQLLRNPNYTGETLNIGNGTAIITATGSGTKYLVSEGDLGNFHRRIQVIGTYMNNVFTVTSWQEIN